MNTAAIPMPLSWSMRLLERNLLPKQRRRICSTTSCRDYLNSTESLDQAEANMLRLTAERAGLEDGDRRIRG
jgi:hypothetical protein